MTASSSTTTNQPTHHRGLKTEIDVHCRHQKWLKWGSNPRLRRDSNLSRAPWTTRPFNRGGTKVAAMGRLRSSATRISSEVGLRKQEKKTAAPKNAPSGNQTRVWSVAGTYTITVLTARYLLVPRIELGTSRVLSERHNQLDHTS